MVAFTGRCLAHRAEIMQLRGAWGDALEEARRADRRFALGMNQAGGGFGLSAKAFALLGVLSQLLAHDLYRHQALQVGILPQKHFSHSTDAQTAH